MSKFIYKDTLQTKYNEGTILTDDIKCKTLEVNKITSDNPYINIDKNINIDGDLTITGSLNADFDLSTIKTNTITSDNNSIDINKSINTNGINNTGTINSSTINSSTIKINTITSDNNSIDINKSINTNNINNTGTINSSNDISTTNIKLDNTNKKVKVNNNNVWDNYICDGQGTLIGKNGIGTNGEIFNDYINNTASGDYSHAEGNGTTASHMNAHAEGNTTRATGMNSHAEGSLTYATGMNSHAEGTATRASALSSHSSGSYTISSQENEFVIGTYNIDETGQTTNKLFVIGNGNINKRNDAFYVKSNGESFIDGQLIIKNEIGNDDTKSIFKINNHTEIGGQEITDNIINITQNKIISTNGCELYGLSYLNINNEISAQNVKASNDIFSNNFYLSGTDRTNSKIMMSGLSETLDIKTSTGDGTFNYNGKIIGPSYETNNFIISKNGNNGIRLNGNTQTIQTTTDGINWNNYIVGSNIGRNGTGTNAEIFNDYTDNIASGQYSHAEGQNNTASGRYSHVEGQNNTASGWWAHAEGYNTQALESFSNSSGRGTISNTEGGMAIGNFNISGTDKLFVVGNGTDNNNRNDAFIIKTSGEIEGNGPLIVKNGNNKIKLDPSTNSIKLSIDNGTNWNDIYLGTKIGTGNSQFLTYANQNTANNASDTRTISNDDFNYVINGNIINISVNLRSGYKFVSAYRSRNDLANDFMNEFLLNIDLSGIKSYLDTINNASASTFGYIGGKCLFYIGSYGHLEYKYYASMSSNLNGQYNVGIVYYIVGLEGSGQWSSTDYGESKYYLQDFSGLSNYNTFNIQLLYIKIN